MERIKMKLYCLKCRKDTEKKFLFLVKLKIKFHGYMLLIISMAKKSLEDFMKKNCKRLSKKNSGQKKYLKEKATNYMLNGKVTIIRLIVGLIKRI